MKYKNSRKSIAKKITQAILDWETVSENRKIYKTKVLGMLTQILEDLTSTPSKEIKPIEWPTKTWDKHMLRKYNKKVDKLIARIVRETQRIEGEMAEKIKPIELPISTDFNIDTVYEWAKQITAHITALESHLTPIKSLKKTKL